jgi:hypothetical protein
LYNRIKNLGQNRFLRGKSIKFSRFLKISFYLRIGSSLDSTIEAPNRNPLEWHDKR